MGSSWGIIGMHPERSREHAEREGEGGFFTNDSLHYQLSVFYSLDTYSVRTKSGLECIMALKQISGKGACTCRISS